MKGEHDSDGDGDKNVDGQGDGEAGDSFGRQNHQCFPR